MRGEEGRRRGERTGGGGRGEKETEREEEVRKRRGERGLEVSEAKLLYCVTVGGGWGEGKGRICTYAHTLLKWKATGRQISGQRERDRKEEEEGGGTKRRKEGREAGKTEEGSHHWREEEQMREGERYYGGEES